MYLIIFLFFKTLKSEQAEKRLKTKSRQNINVRYEKSIYEKNIFTPPFKFLTITTVLLLFLTSCQKTDTDPLTNSEETETETVASKVIDFKGLTVNHRFRTPVENLELDLIESSLKQMYTKIKNPLFKISKTSSTQDLLELPDTDIIIEATKLVADKFPYDLEREPIFIRSDQQKYLDTVSIEIRKYILENNLIDFSKDSLRLVEHEKYVSELNMKQEERKTKMIKEDFSSLSEEQIAANIELIDEYYTKNMNYEILLTAEEKKQELATKIASKTQKTTNYGYEPESNSHKICMAKNSGRLLSESTIKDAGNDAKTLAAEYYNGFGLDGANDRRDAFRHMMWNVLLAKYYSSFSASRSNRTDFAKDVTDAYEECGNNDKDSEAMDLRNNAIGRDVYWDNTSIRRFWFAATGVNEASTTTYAEDAKNRVENNSCFIVKVYREDRFPERFLLDDDFNKDETYIKSKIEATEDDVAVYFIGPIAPSYQYLPTSQYDYSTCTEEDKPWVTQITVDLPYWLFPSGTYTYNTYSPCVNRYNLKCYQL